MDSRSLAITSIYDAALTENRWRPALDHIRATTEADALMLYEFGPDLHVDYSVNATCSAFDGFDEVLADYNRMVNAGEGSNFDEQGLGATHLQPQFSSIEDTEIWTLDEAFLRRPEVRIAKESLGVLRRFLTNLSDDPLRVSGLIHMYDLGLEDRLPAGDPATARLIAPHVAKAVELNRMTNELRRRYRAVLSVLDRIDVAICLLNPSGDVILRNAAADRLFQKDDGIRLGRNDRLVCHSDDDTVQLDHHARALSRTAAGDETTASAAIEIARPDGSIPYLGMISPLRDADMELERGLTGAILTIIDPDALANVRVDLVAQAYRLTAAEARVATLMTGGLQNPEIALRLEVGVETVKSQVAAVLEKCRCHSRLAFLWRVFQFSPPVR